MCDSPATGIRDPTGQRPCGTVLEDYNAGLGAPQQTGWTGLVADVILRRHVAYPKTSNIVERLVQGEESR